LEVGLIGRDYNLIGQILEIFKDKEKNREKKKEYSAKGIVGEQEYSKGVERKGSELTSSTMKLMAIFSQGRGSKIWEIGEEGLR